MVPRSISIFFSGAYHIMYIDNLTECLYYKKEAFYTVVV